MLKRKINLPTPTTPNPISGQTSIVTVPAGLRVHQITLKITASTGTNLPIGNWIGDIRVKLGGKVQRLHSANELNLLNATNNPPAVTGSAASPTPYSARTVGTSGSNYGQELTIFFAEPWRKSTAQAEFLAWPTSADSLLEVEIDCNGTPTGTTPTISIAASAVVDTEKQPGQDKRGLVISKVFRSDLPAAATLDYQTLDRRDLYQAVYISLGSQSVSKATLKADGTIVHELNYEENKSYLAFNEMSEQFNYSLVLDGDDPLESGLPAKGLSDLQLRIENSAAPSSMRVLAQRMGTPE